MSLQKAEKEGSGNREIRKIHIKEERNMRNVAQTEELFPIVDAGSSPAVPHQRFVAVATLKTPNTGCWRNEPQQCAAAGALTEVSSAGQSGGLISRVSRVRVPDFRGSEGNSTS